MSHDCNCTGEATASDPREDHLRGTLQRRQRRAFEELLSEHLDALFRTALRLCGGHRAVAQVRTATSGAASQRRRWLWGAAAVLAAVVALVIGGKALRAPESGRAMAVFVDDHLRAIKGEGIAASDSLIVVQWLADRLPMAVDVPLFPAARLTGARVAMMGERRAAVLQYELRGRTLSYYVMPAHAPAWSGTGTPTLRYASRAGYRVVAWQDAGLTHALVADLPEAHLADLARYCMHQMLALVRRVAPEAPAG